MADEVGALTKFAAGVAHDATEGIGAVHGAIADRAFGATGPAGRTPKAVHDAIATGVYESVRLGFRLGGATTGAVLGLVSQSAGWAPLSETSKGSSVLAVLNGFAGDRLHEQNSALATSMTVRHDNRSVALTTDGLSEAFPAATGHVTVFLHGLVETEHAWRWGAEKTYGNSTVTYGSRLADDLAVTPVFVRYNTGRHISENGAELDELMHELVAAWPVPIAQLDLVGHSMGGLLIRSVCHRAADAERPWVARLRHAVYLGTPHLGAPLARGAARLGQVFDRFPETRPLAALLKRPSAGIGDLRHGSLLDQDWQGLDVDEWLDAACAEVGLLPHCRHHAVSAGVSEGGNRLFDNLLGDLLVQTSSASGQGNEHRRVDFVATEGLSVTGAHHFSLLNHPRIYEQLRTWLEDPPPP